METKVHLYERGTWGHVSTLSDDLLTQVRSGPLGGHVVVQVVFRHLEVEVVLCPLQPINVVAWSPCGQFLAAGSVGGSLTVWNVSSRLCVERYGRICRRLSRCIEAEPEVVLSLQAEARKRLHRVLFGLASVWRSDRLHRHRGAPGPAGRTRHLRRRHHQGNEQPAKPSFCRCADGLHNVYDVHRTLSRSPPKTQRETSTTCLTAMMTDPWMKG